jgi:hypothetical protein
MARQPIRGDCQLGAHRSHRATVWAFFGGLFLDLMSGAPFAVSSMALVIAVYRAADGGRFWSAHSGPWA